MLRLWNKSSREEEKKENEMKKMVEEDKVNIADIPEIIKKQKSLIDYLEKQIPPNKWRLNPDRILNGYNNKEIDKETALYMLETLFYEADDKWAKISFRKECLKAIVKLSRKDKKLRRLLEEIFITEYWYPLRLQALSLIHRHYTQLSVKLFNYIHENTSLIQYGLREWHIESISFLKDLIKDPLVLFYLVIKKVTKDFSEYLSIEDRKIKINGNDFYIGITKRFRRSALINELTPQDILETEAKYFVYSRREKDGIIYEVDKEERYAQFCIHIIETEKYKVNYCIPQKILLAIFQAIKEVFSISEFTIRIEKTSIYYLIIDIEEIEVFLKYRLGGYRIEI